MTVFLEVVVDLLKYRVCASKIKMYIAGPVWLWLDLVSIGGFLKIAVCGICRNEVSYVKEWVAFYKTSGFDSVYVYDNVSDDGTSELLASLDAVGEVKRVHWPRKEGIPPQRDAYGHFLETFSSEYDYVLICDLDEFLFISDNSVKGLLREAEEIHGDVGAIAFPWLLFGSSGLEEQSSDLVLSRFKRCDEKVTNVVKTMFAPRFVYNMRTHICDLTDGVYLDNTLGLAKWRQDMPIKLVGPKAGRGAVHHYYTKSRAEWVRRRALPKADRSVVQTKDLAEFERYHDQQGISNIADRCIPAVRHYIKEIEGRVGELNARMASASVNLIAVNKDWVFGYISGVSENKPFKVRVLNSQGHETVVNTKPCPGGIHVVIVKTKWRDTFSPEFTISIVGDTRSRFFKRSDWPENAEAVELMAAYTPNAEAHIFSYMLDTFGQAPEPRLLDKVLSLPFYKNRIYKDFLQALRMQLSEPSSTSVKDFLATCPADFVVQVSDVKNKRRKFISDLMA